jgi:hypothetical protein
VYGNEEMVTLLLDKRANPEGQGIATGRREGLWNNTRGSSF